MIKTKLTENSFSILDLDLERARILTRGGDFTGARLEVGKARQRLDEYQQGYRYAGARAFSGTIKAYDISITATAELVAGMKKQKIKKLKLTEEEKAYLDDIFREGFNPTALEFKGGQRVPGEQSVFVNTSDGNSVKYLIFHHGKEAGRIYQTRQGYQFEVFGRDNR